MLLKYFLFTVILGVTSFFILNEDLEVVIKQFFKGVYDYFRHLKKKLLPSNELLYSAKELSLYDGKQDTNLLYLSIMGRVYDVSKGKQHYAPGGSYHGFAGRDASKAFITGDFTEKGLTDDISELSDEDLSSIKDWVKMYDSNYVYKGKLIGRFYDEEGQPTPFLKSVNKKVAKHQKVLAKKTDDKKKFPPCNTEWSQELGGRVWCSKKSGGIERDWVGVPRKYYQPGSSSSRCACINLKTHKTGSFEIYKDCHPEAESCNVKE